MKKKNGFTLAEILISVGIIGVVAALMLPMVNKYKPDENKIRYLQTYNTIMEIMPSIVNNTKAFPMFNDTDDDVKYVYDLFPLMNTSSTVIIDGTSYSGAAKFCRLLAMGLNTTGDISCSDDFKTDALENFTPSFKTFNGIEYMVQTRTDNESYITEIYLDVNGTGHGGDCFVGTEGCKDVDRFKILVGPDGNVKAADSMGEAHLLTQTNWKMNRDKVVNAYILNDVTTVNLEKIVGNEDNGDDRENDNNLLFNMGARGAWLKIHNGKDCPDAKPFLTPFYLDVVNYKNKPPIRGMDFRNVKKSKYNNIYEYNGDYYYYSKADACTGDLLPIPPCVRPEGYSGYWMRWEKGEALDNALRFLDENPDYFAKSRLRENIPYEDKGAEDIQNPYNVSW